MDQAAYEAERARLKEARRVASEALGALRYADPSPAEYSKAVIAYAATQDALEAWYRLHLGPKESRADRRKRKLRARGITPVWERP